MKKSQQTENLFEPKNILSTMGIIEEK